MMYKAVNGKIAFQIPEYFKPKQRITRHYHQSHEIHIFKPSSNTQKFSFQARTKPESLPAEVWINQVLRRSGKSRFIFVLIVIQLHFSFYICGYWYKSLRRLRIRCRLISKKMPSLLLKMAVLYISPVQVYFVPDCCAVGFSCREKFDVIFFIIISYN